MYSSDCPLRPGHFLLVRIAQLLALAESFELDLTMSDDGLQALLPVELGTPPQLLYLIIDTSTSNMVGSSPAPFDRVPSQRHG